jgi:hypothetical protein
MPGRIDLLHRILNGLRELPGRIVGLHLRQVRVIANVITDPVLVDVFRDRFPTRDILNYLESFENRDRVRFTPAEIVDLSNFRRGYKSRNERCYVRAVNIVSNLLTLVAKDSVTTPLKIAANEIAQETV